MEIAMSQVLRQTPEALRQIHLVSPEDSFISSASSPIRNKGCRRRRTMCVDAKARTNTFSEVGTRFQRARHSIAVLTQVSVVCAALQLWDHSFSKLFVSASFLSSFNKGGRSSFSSARWLPRFSRLFSHEKVRSENKLAFSLGFVTEHPVFSFW